MNEKIENLLNISLNVDEVERLKSPGLSTGYDNKTKIWEIIIKYTGDIQNILQKYIRADESVRVKELINNYAIVHTPKKYIDAIAGEEYIEFVEKPKQMYFQLQAGKAQSCISRVSSGNSLLQLNGSGVIVAIIDTGIDIKDMRFRNSDGTTRILNIYDQSLGIEWNKQDIDNYIFFENELTTDNIRSAARVTENDFVIGVDITGHGTDVAAIACGSDGVAPKADIIIVKMAVADTDSFPRTTQLMEALDYVIKKAVMYKEPVAVNISFGNNYGSHTGNSLSELYLNRVSLLGRISIIAASGNEGASPIHTLGFLDQTVNVDFSISERQTSLNMQLWKDYADAVRIRLRAPSGTEYTLSDKFGTNIEVLDQTQIAFYNSAPSPFQRLQEYYFEFFPIADSFYLTSGVWSLIIEPISIKNGTFEMWLPAASSLNGATRFLSPDPYNTLTVPSSANSVITVGAYDAKTNTPADFSGRGAASMPNLLTKPDLVAPGVSVIVPSFPGGYQTVSGTSFAAPFVTGSAALLMEWGIVKRNNLFLYGEQLKAWLIAGAKELPGYPVPNPRTGWGALCLEAALR